MIGQRILLAVLLPVSPLYFPGLSSGRPAGGRHSGTTCSLRRGVQGKALLCTSVVVELLPRVLYRVCVHYNAYSVHEYGNQLS